MPTWLEYVVGFSAGIGCLVLVFDRFVKPLADAVAFGKTALPVLRSLTDVFGDDTLPMFHVLESMASEFRTDNGNSLRDIIDGLTRSAEDSRQAAAVIAVGAAAAKELAERDREQLLHLIKQLDRLTVRVEDGAIAAARVGRASVGRDKVVADNLADAQKRADAHPGEEPGSAADAAASSA